MFTEQDMFNIVREFWIAEYGSDDSSNLKELFDERIKKYQKNAQNPTSVDLGTTPFLDEITKEFHKK